MFGAIYGQKMRLNIDLVLDCDVSEIDKEEIGLWSSKEVLYKDNEITVLWQQGRVDYEESKLQSCGADGS